MSDRGAGPKGSRPEAGYALLLAVFLAATMFLVASIAVPSIVNQGRREKEQQLIWRGNQYARGIRLYFQKNGRFPQTKDELIKGTLSVHFVRKAFTDPVASSGDDWRLIYVNPSGQLIGSVRYHTLQEMAAALSANGQNAGNLAALFGGAPTAQTSGPGAAGAQGATGRGGGVAGPAGARGGPGALAAGGGAGQTPDAQGGTGMGQQPTPVPLQAVDGPVFGASMIGVASKVKQDSLLVYQGKDNYFQWEFIWNPLLNGAVGGAPVPPQTGVGVGAPGATQPAGTGIGTGTMPPMGQPPAGAGRGAGAFPMSTSP